MKPSSFRSKYKNSPQRSQRAQREGLEVQSSINYFFSVSSVLSVVKNFAKLKAIFLLLFLGGCMLPPAGSDMLVKLSPTKQKQKIAFLQKKLELAEREQKKVEEDIEFLQEEMKQAELALVRRIVFETEEKLRKFEENPSNRWKFTENEISNLFLDEREILHRMIQAGPTPASLEAQGVLDQILRMITSLSDEPQVDERTRL
jgi:hypothetical protein